MSDLVRRQAASDNFRELVETGFRLRRLLLRIVLVILALTVVIALIVRPHYVASSQFLVLPSEEYTFHPLAGSQSLANEAMSRKAIMGSEIAILKAPALARAVIAEIGLHELYPALARKPGAIARAFAWMHALVFPHNTPQAHNPLDRAVPVFLNHLTVDAGAENDLLTLSFAARNPALARHVLDTLDRLYLIRRQALFTDLQSAAVAREVAADREALDRAETKLTNFEAAHNVTRFETRETILLDQQGKMEQNLMNATTSIAEFDARLAALKGARKTEPSTIRLLASTNMDERTQAVRVDLDALKSKLASELDNYRADSPEVASLRQKIAAQSALLAHSLRNGAASSVESGQNPVYAEINLQTMRDSTALAAARGQAKQDRAGLQAIGRRLARLDVLKTALARLESRKSIAAAAYADASKILGERQIVEEVAAEKRANVRLLSSPMLPLAPYPLRKLIGLGGVILALLAAIMTIFLGNMFRKGVLLGRVLEAEARIPLLAVVPDLGAAEARRLSV